MEIRKCLWYDLLINGKKELGWKDGLSIPFLVGAYSRKRKKNYGSLLGLKEIFNEILETLDDEEIAIEKCGGYTTMDVYIVKVLSDINASSANNSRKNFVYENKIYTTLMGVESLDALIDKLWDMYKDCILEGYFSAQSNLSGDYWRQFNTTEEKLIDEL